MELTTRRVALNITCSRGVLALLLRPVYTDFELCDKPAFNVDPQTYWPDEHDGPIFRAVLEVLQTFGVTFARVDYRMIRLDRDSIDPIELGMAIKRALDAAGVGCTDPEITNEVVAVE